MSRWRWWNSRAYCGTRLTLGKPLVMCSKARESDADMGLRRTVPRCGYTRRAASRLERDRRRRLLGKRGFLALALRDALVRGRHAHRGGPGVLQACPRAPARVGVSALGLSGGFWEALVGQYFSAASIARACRFSIACLLTVQAAPVAALWHGRARGFP